MVELNPEEIKAAGLEDKIQLFWSNEKQRYETKTGETLKVVPIGTPRLIVSTFKVKIAPYCGDVYTIKDAKHEHSTILGGPEGLRGATHYALGGQNDYLEEQWGRKAIATAVIYFKTG